MPEYLSGDTIAAIATPPGEGGLAVIRLSGPDSLTLAAKIFFPANGLIVLDFPSHTVHFGTIKTVAKTSEIASASEPADKSSPFEFLAMTTMDGQVLDQALLSVFRAPRSYTGELVVELSLHGGTLLARKVLDLLISAGARMAEPGEFTRRAFLNGKLDLTQAEAVLDLIHSKSSRALETAARQLTGSLSLCFKRLKEDLMQLYAHMEAFLDFPEEDLEVYSDTQMKARLAKVTSEVQGLVQSFTRGHLIREGAVVVITGKPNVGKSSLFNVLIERDRALVSPYAGTTRDAIEEWLEVEGYGVKLVDTAGLMAESGHPLDALAVQRTQEVLKSADAYLFVADGSQTLDAEDRQAFQALDSAKPCLFVAAKSDLGLPRGTKTFAEFSGAENFVSVSAEKRSGLVQLEVKLAGLLKQGAGDAAGEQITRLRHRRALETALEALQKTSAALDERASLELVAFDLKRAIDSLRELIGEIYSEDLLDVLFSEFCIGK